jgi:hypothetical protein
MAATRQAGVQWQPTMATISGSCIARDTLYGKDHGLSALWLVRRPDSGTGLLGKAKADGWRLRRLRIELRDLCFEKCLLVLFGTFKYLINEYS